MDSPGCQPRIWRQISRDAGMITSGSFNGRDSWRIAYASAKEVDSHLRRPVQAEVVDGRGAKTALNTFGELRAMTWRLLDPRS